MSELQWSKMISGTSSECHLQRQQQRIEGRTWEIISEQEFARKLMVLRTQQKHFLTDGIKSCFNPINDALHHAYAEKLVWKFLINKF